MLGYNIKLPNNLTVETKSKNINGDHYLITLDDINKNRLDELIKKAGNKFKGIYVSYSKITGNYTVYFKTVEKRFLLKNLLLNSNAKECVILKDGDGLNLSSINLVTVNKSVFIEKNKPMYVKFQDKNERSISSFIREWESLINL